MVTFLALFFPSVLSVWIWDAVCKPSVCNRGFVYLYSLNAMIVNLGCFAMKKWIRHSGEYPLENMTPNSAMNYIIIAALLAVVLAVIEIVIYKRVRIQIESNVETEDGAENEES